MGRLNYKKLYIELVLNCISCDEDSISLNRSSHFPNGLPDELSDNKKFMLEAVKASPMGLELASDRLKDDSDVVIAAIEAYDYMDEFIIEHASKRLQKLYEK